MIYQIPSKNILTKGNVLTIAGSDCLGKAGMQADIKAILENNANASTAITAITAQNSKKVYTIEPVSSKLVKQQIKSICEEISINAIKIGMLYNKEITIAVYDAIKNLKVPIITDPVLTSSSGTELLEASAFKYLRENIFPISQIVTPNIPETKLLSNFQIKSRQDIVKAGKYLLQFGCKYVLIKGGHIQNYIPQNQDIIEDILISKTEVISFTNKKVNKKIRGTGCMLASAIAANIANKYSLKDSVKLAHNYIANMFRINPRIK